MKDRAVQSSLGGVFSAFGHPLFLGVLSLLCMHLGWSWFLISRDIVSRDNETGVRGGIYADVISSENGP